MAAIRLADGVDITTGTRTLNEPVRTFWERYLQETGDRQQRTAGRWNVTVAREALTQPNFPGPLPAPPEALPEPHRALQEGDRQESLESTESARQE